MPTRLVPDNDTEAALPGVDRHYYEKQIGAGSPFDETYAFRLAVARAKDDARHKLIRAVQAERDKADAGQFYGTGQGVILNRTDDVARSLVKRSIDGVDGAPDNDIKL